MLCYCVAGAEHFLLVGDRADFLAELEASDLLAGRQDGASAIGRQALHWT